MTATTPATSRALANGRTALQLHHLRAGEGQPLLLLHELFGSAEKWGAQEIPWEGPVWALDFAGHGASNWRKGGAYFPELFATDADTALQELGPACIAGAGLGAYVALLLAGARPEKVTAALLLPGAGLAGGGDDPAAAPDPDSLRHLLQTHKAPGNPEDSPHDPRLLLAQDDTRPVDYARSFGSRSTALLLAEDDSDRPGWWMALRDLPKVKKTSVDQTCALQALAKIR